MKKLKRCLSLFLTLVLLLAAVPVTTVQALTAAEMSSAKPLTIGETVDVSLGEYESVYYSIQTTKPGQIITYDKTYNSNSYYVEIIDSNGKYCSSAYAASVGTYYLELYTSATASGTLTVTLIDNDSHEPNNTQQTATALQSGEPVELILAPSDEDWLMIETTKDGQDIQLDIGGFNYANKGDFYLEFDGIEYNDRHISGNGTHYFHAAKAGKHYLQLYNGYSSSALSLPLTVTATVLDGDANECNDTKQTATALELGTDLRFSVGGWGDEDWFRFEVAPDADGNDLYTLRFLDLNPNYSDKLYYEVYSPSGALLCDRTYINISHANILECSEQGSYYIRVLTISGMSSYDDYAYSDIDAFTRSSLRLRVSKGGSDPHESNDTWLTATPLQPDQLTQHVLSSSSDADWFRFTAPEADMSFALDMSHDTCAQLYRAADLAEQGEDADSYFYAGRYSLDSVKTMYCKLAEAGVYYLKLTTETAYATEDLRSFTVTLDSPGDEENNDTWDRAVPLYESVPQSFALAGKNDVDWFKLVLTEESQVNFNFTGATDSSTYFWLYRETDILHAGLNASSIHSGDLYSYKNSPSYTYTLNAGTYYLRLSRNSDYGRTDTITLKYTFPPTRGSTLADAIPLAAGEWSDSLAGMRYYSLGELKAGDTVQVSRDANGQSPNFYLLDSSGYSYSETYYSSASWSIPSDGAYYLKVNATDSYDENGDQIPSRVRYFVSSGSGSATAIDGPDELTLYVGQKQFVDLRLSPTGASGGSIYLDTNSNSSVASYDSYSDYITANAVGTTTMTFRSYPGSGSGYIYKDVVVTVKDAVPATDISIADAPASMSVGERVYLHEVLTPAESAAAVTWSSSDPKVLYVFPGGKAVAVGEGTATVTATAGELTASASVTVRAAAPTQTQITSLLLDRYSLTLYLNESTQTLTASTQPAGIDASIAWTSSNPAAATVSQTGVVTAVAPGISIITAAAGDHNVSCVVTVQAPRVRVTGISFAETSLQLPLGGESVLTPTLSPYNATTRTLTWVSDNEAVATVSRTGVVHALAVGTTVIRATTLDGGFVAELPIEVTASPQPGDINGDGYVDAGDALLCLKNAVGLIELTAQQRAAGDVNHDGYVDAGDAVKILRYNAQLIDSLE